MIIADYISQFPEKVISAKKFLFCFVWEKLWKKQPDTQNTQNTVPRDIFESPWNFLLLLILI